MIRINEIIASLGTGADELKKMAASELGISVSDIDSFEIARESIDSRKKNNIKKIYSLNVQTHLDEARLIADLDPKKVRLYEKYSYVPPVNRRTSVFRPVIVGFGPAGMFAALVLSHSGLKPIVLERGNDVDTRTKNVYDFWRTGSLDINSNVQFGEGGAGTFSDGKLTTGIKDPRCSFVLETFYKYGAPEQILYSSHPHIGTDRLRTVVRNMREDILSHGAEVRFGCCLRDIYVSNGYIHGVSYTDVSGNHDLETDCLLLCIGHSARDTVKMLHDRGVSMEKKAFSVGVRIEHPQELINRALFGLQWNDPRLGAANYKFANHPLHGRGGYTFCMCPGGTVVCASSEENAVVVNGMSTLARDGENANAAILVGIEPDYFPGDDPLAGIAFQRALEQKAFHFGGGTYAAPGQRVGDFLNNKKSFSFGSVHPTCPTGVEPSDVRMVLPSIVTNDIALAILAFDKKLPGFALPDAVLTAPESRSSSPVRILRDEFRQSNFKGIFPCGEGAGYAGGIVSAAVDGIKSAEAVLADEIDDC